MFQAHKFLNEYPHLAETIRQLPTARDALEEAGHLQRFKRADWFDVNVGIMDTVLQAKFDQHRELCHMLLDTQGRDLMEASPVGSPMYCVFRRSHLRSSTGGLFLGYRSRRQRQK